MTSAPAQQIAHPQGIVYASTIPFNEERIHAAAVYCSDGRFGEQMDEFLQQGLGLPRYDRVAVPGGAACLAGHVTAYYEKNAVERQLQFLIQVHGLGKMVLIAHEGCAFYKDLWSGSRSIEQLQAADLEKAAERVRLSHPKMEVEMYFARHREGRVVFEKWGEQKRWGL